MNKVKILLRIAKKLIRKALCGDFRYRGKLYPVYISHGLRYLVKFGPSASLRKVKQELISIDRRYLGGNLAFPNGFVTRVIQ